MNSQCEHLCSIIFFVVAADVAPFVIERDGNLGIVDKNFISARTKDKLLWLPLLALWWVFFFVAAEIKSRMHCKYSHNAIQKMDFFPGIDNRIKACFSGFTVMFSFFSPVILIFVLSIQFFE